MKREELNKLRSWADGIYHAANHHADKLDPKRRRKTSVVQALERLAVAANNVRLMCDVELQDLAHSSQATTQTTYKEEL
jgi:hypothetical protein